MAGDDARIALAVYGIMVSPTDRACIQTIADALIRRFGWRGDGERMVAAAKHAADMVEYLRD